MTFSEINSLNCGYPVSQSEDQKNFTLEYCQFRRFIEVKLSMLPDKEIFKFLTVLSLFGEFFLYSYETRVCFFILHCIIYANYSNSFLSV